MDGDSIFFALACIAVFWAVVFLALGVGVGAWLF